MKKRQKSGSVCSLREKKFISFPLSWFVVIFLFIVNSFFGTYSDCKAQSWHYETNQDEFNGKFKICYVTGVGSDYPYNDPVFVIRKKLAKVNSVEYSNSNDSLSFYIRNAPYSACDVNTIKIKFNNSDTIFFPPVTLSTGRTTWFLNIQYNEDEFIAFMRLLKTGSKMTVRFSNSCMDSYTARFPLTGSKAAINYISR